MQSMAAVLRQTRSEVIPIVPELAPWLPMKKGTTEPDIIQEELLDAIANHGIDPDTVSAPDFNKLTRHTLIGSMIGLQGKYLVEGEGRDAHFTEEVLESTAISGNPYLFIQDIQEVQAFGYRHLRSTYRAGRDVAHSWFPLLERRQQELAEIGAEITPQPPNFRKTMPSSPIPPGEGETVYGALTTIALGSSVAYLLGLVQHKVKDRDARLDAAHDTAQQFLGGLASSHFYEFREVHPGPKKIKGDIVKNHKTGLYRLRQTPQQRRELFPHLSDNELPNVRLKCPAHAAVEAGDTNLLNLSHATINLAPRYKLV